VQYRVAGVHLTGLTVASGVSRCPQYVKICLSLFIIGNRREETEGSVRENDTEGKNERKRQRGIDTEEETRGEETQRKRQRGET
jgi:hypothetical protein